MFRLWRKDKLQCSKMRPRPGLRPGPRWRSLQHSPKLPRWLQEKWWGRGEGMKGDGKREEVKGEGEEGKGGRGSWNRAKAGPARTTYPWKRFRHLRRRWWRCGSNAGCRYSWWLRQQRSPVRYRRRAASVRSRRIDDPDVQCPVEAWVQWSESDRVSSLELPEPSSLTVPTHCDAPVTVTHTHTQPCHTKITSYTVWVKKCPWSRFCDFFPKWLGIFSPNFIRLLHVPIYPRLQIFIQLSPTLTKLCHTIKWQMISRLRSHEWGLLTYALYALTYIPSRRRL